LRVLHPAATADEVNWILKEIQAYVSPDVKVRQSLYMDPLLPEKVPNSLEMSKTTKL
jgi:hypothetical protein